MEDQYEWVETTEHIILEFGSRNTPSSSWLNNIDQGIQLVGLDGDEVFFRAGGTVYQGFYEDNALSEDLVFTIQGDIPTAQEDEEDGPFAQQSSTRRLAGEDEEDLEALQDETGSVEDYDEEPIDATMELVGVVTKKIFFEKVVVDINNPAAYDARLRHSTQYKEHEADDEQVTATAPTTDGEGTTSEMDLDRQ
ncbi:hypothetical protein DFQ27_002173 [Actinomortierella ambigua]|uniref:Transcription factor TFIIIC triple barrel domain-containing protein n=1 Tax=Actinomortierella ambigua TaxID=1343610 RepID=A0A9P6QKT9_9FUNG|nr:hypothetical protein DFQ27_002173 [Actinomortierella ambigua]